MRLRTMALVVGALGVVVLAVGLVADATRPERTVTAEVPVEATVVVIGPEVLALAPEGRIAVSGPGALEAHVARPVDAEQWLADYSATRITGLADWATLTTREVEPVEPEPSASPSVSPSASPSVSPSASPSPSASEGAEDGAGQTDEVTEPAFVTASRDHWRDSWQGTDRLSVSIAEVPAGLPLIMTSTTGEPLTQADMLIDREINDGWITPLIWWGVLLTVLGLVALVFYIVDLRPVQARVETWMAQRRRRKANAEPAPGSRRARRTDTAGIPIVDHGAAADTEAQVSDDETETAMGTEPTTATGADDDTSADTTEPSETTQTSDEQERR